MLFHFEKYYKTELKKSFINIEVLEIRIINFFKLFFKYSLHNKKIIYIQSTKYYINQNVCFSQKAEGLMLQQKYI